MLNEELSLCIVGKPVVDEDVAAVEITQTVDVDVASLQKQTQCTSFKICTK